RQRVRIGRDTLDPRSVRILRALAARERSWTATWLVNTERWRSSTNHSLPWSAGGGFLLRSSLSTAARIGSSTNLLSRARTIGGTSGARARATPLSWTSATMEYRVP